VGYDLAIDGPADPAMRLPVRASGALVTLARAGEASDLPALVGDGGILVLAPHADDETLGCGAAIMAALAEGRRVVVALLTGGNAGAHGRSLRAASMLRRREFAEALARLSAGAGGRPIETICLGRQDRAVPQEREALARYADRLAETARDAGIDTIWSTWHGDGHSDHIAAARLADLVEARLADQGTRAVRRDYPIWGRFSDTLPEERVLTFALDRWQRAKAHALVSYASQISYFVRSRSVVMPPALTAHFASAPEIFLAPAR